MGWKTTSVRFHYQKNGFKTLVCVLVGVAVVGIIGMREQCGGKMIRVRWSKSIGGQAGWCGYSSGEGRGNKADGVDFDGLNVAGRCS